MNFAAQLNAAWDAALNLVFPPVCQVCRAERATADGGYVGPACRAQIRLLVPPFCDRCGMPFDGEITGSFECSHCQDLTLHFRCARSAVVVNPLILHVIHHYKYNRALWFETFLADLLVREAAPQLRAEHWDWIVPVPLHPGKEREREFNQAERLGRHLARATGVPVRKNLLRRVKNTATQTQLTRTERASNMDDAFATQPGAKLAGEKIILLDDVFTTGATTNACAKVLQKAGAGDVAVWTVARGA